ncbi:hypothetical protein ABAC460_22605 [Asticcacaulis sp. AC460]|nr:hypothetical protein ABAC460_22605 [Asticcacaulis sp. AC460]
MEGGGYIITWSDSAAGATILAQRYDAQGNEVGEQITVNTTGYWVFNSTVIGLSDGGFMLSWYSGTSDWTVSDYTFNVAARRYDASGNAVGGEFIVNTTRPGDQGNPSMAELSNGDVVIAWVSKDDGLGAPKLLFQRYTASGALSGVETRIDVASLAVLDPLYRGFTIVAPKVAALANGGFVVVWASNAHDGDGLGITARIFDANGVAAGTEFLVNAQTAGDQYAPSITTLDDGGYVVTWLTADVWNVSFGGNSVRAQRFAADGTRLGNEFRIGAVTDGTSYVGEATTLTDGSLVVTWSSDDGAAVVLWAQHYDAMGNAIGDAFRLTQGSFFAVDLAPLDGGGFVATWTSTTPNGLKVFERHFSLVGTEGQDMVILGDVTAESIDGAAGADEIHGGGAADTLNGVAGDDRLSGEAGDDVLNGGAGRDILAGGLGADTVTAGDGGGQLWHAGQGVGAEGDTDADLLTGGAGADDIYAGIGDSAHGGGQGAGEIDRLFILLNGATASVTLDLSGADPYAGIAAATGGSCSGFEAIGAIYGSAYGDRLTGTAGGDKLYEADGALGGADTFWGGAGDDWLSAGQGDNVVDGGDGDDTFFKTGQGREILSGGAGNDTVVFGSPFNTAYAVGGGEDIVYGGAGIDLLDFSRLAYGQVLTIDLSLTVQQNTGFNLITVDGIENVTGGAGWNHLIGNDGNNVLIGRGVSSTLEGGAGDDILYANASSNWLSGGTGNDTYYNVSWLGYNYAVPVTEAANEGVDTIVSSFGLDMTMMPFVENLVVGGDYAGTGNAQANQLTGGSGGNYLDGAAGADTLRGEGGSDYLVGNGGDDLVLGGAGNDGMVGGDGTDTVSFNDAAASVTVSLAITSGQVTGAGWDTLSGFENLTGSGFSDRLTGDANANRIDGGAGSDRMIGGLGNDTYIVDNAGDSVGENHLEGTDTIISSVSYSLFGRAVEILTLTGAGNLTGTGNSLNNVMTGNSGNNTLDGAAGNDVLDGGAGIDRLLGGLGDDTYYVDNAADSVGENHLEGTDTIISSVSYSLFGRAVEVLTLTGTGNLNGTGNSLNNTLTGNAGNNVLDGGAGVDKLVGGFGDDTYYVDNAGDNVQEQHLQGTDTVFSSVTYSLLGRAVEVMTLTGGGNINATGNSLNNILTGNSGNNRLDGGVGNDTLAGGLGSDVFVFMAGTWKDTVTDFSAAQNDSIDIHAVTNGVANAGMVTQSGANVLINLGGGNTVTVMGATQADVLSHMVW